MHGTVPACFWLFLLRPERVTLHAAQVLLMGYVMIMIGTALTGFIPLMMNFKPAAFGIGMAVFACCPTSLSQGVTVVIQGYGNAALALLLVVLTNLVGGMWRCMALSGCSMCKCIFGC